MAKMLQDSLKRNPADTSLYVQLGAVLIATGDTVGALSAYRKYAVEINPANLGAQTDYGYLLFITGSRAEGKLRTLNVLKKEPKNQIAMYNLAAMSYKEENIDEAILWMDRCIAANSTSEMATMARSAKEQLQSQKKQK
jgi:cytochrome c-type biogenesis protein CcmH/NrfG